MGAQSDPGHQKKYTDATPVTAKLSHWGMIVLSWVIHQKKDIRKAN
jgi:hypothetical protein